jgi:hypothetical protein
MHLGHPSTNPYSALHALASMFLKIRCSFYTSAQKEMNVNNLHHVMTGSDRYFQVVSGGEVLVSLIFFILLTITQDNSRQVSSMHRHEIISIFWVTQVAI